MDAFDKAAIFVLCLPGIILVPVMVVVWLVVGQI
jgi:hypothetical protein